LKDGALNVSSLAYAYGDNLNLTGITDGVTAANSNVLSYSATNREVKIRNTPQNKTGRL
jgi:hypothetical protein